MDGADMERILLALTVNQLTDILGVGRNTAYDIVRSGQIPSVRVGRQIRISRGALMDFLCKVYQKEIVPLEEPEITAFLDAVHGHK